MKIKKSVFLLLSIGMLSIASAVSATPSAKKIVVLGSSTAAGEGATSGHSYVSLYTAYLQSLNANNSVIDLAVGGYTTFQELPTGSPIVVGRPAVDVAHNITAALSYKPDGIILNLPTNDTANGYTNAETEANFATIVSTATAAGVPIWVSTTQPRNLNTQQRANLMIVRDWINATYGAHALDFWSVIANIDGSIATAYNSGDGIHLNNSGHNILFTRVVASGLINSLYISTLPTIWIKSVGPNSTILAWNWNPQQNSFRIEKSPDLKNWENVIVPQITIGTETTVTVPRTAEDAKYFFRAAYP